jgi:hypothetical protein
VDGTEAIGITSGISEVREEGARFLRGLGLSF